MVESLEKVLADKATTVSQQNILPEEEYFKRFYTRYKHEKSFRQSVHKFMHLSLRSRLRLGITEKLFPKHYNKETEVMIETYARDIRNKTIEAYRTIEEAQKATQEVKQLDKVQEEIATTQQEHFEKQEQYQELERGKNEAQRVVENEIQVRIEQEHEKARQQQEEITVKTDATRIAQEKLKEIIVKTNLVQVDNYGSITDYNHDLLTGKLEDMFLNEIVADIEKETGRTGFLARVKAEYEGLINHFGEMDDLSEISEIDWVDSIIHSQMRGYKIPRAVDHFIVAKYGKGYSRGRVSVDHAEVIDISGSMNENDRFEVARKTALANNALMRKLNPNTKGFLAVYNESVTEVTSRQLMTEIQPCNGTNTHLAINWLIEKLKDCGPSIATLVTDGLPNYLEKTIEAAKEFRKYSNIRFRIFLVDSEGVEQIRQIGRAAGNETRVIPIDRYHLANGVVGDISNSIRGMYSIDEF
jgi:hypothetical protein